MKIIIMNKIQAVEYCRNPHEEKSIMISIRSLAKEEAIVFESSLNGVQDVLFLAFNDEIEDKHHCMTLKDAQKIVEFLQYNEDSFETIIVNCEAGICRSAGVAGALMKYFNGDDRPAFANGKIPNMTCYTRTLNTLMEK